MQTTSKINQLSSIPQVDSRMMDLRVWMIRNDVSFTSIGKACGITSNAVQQLLKASRISVARYKEFVDFGVPAHLLPPEKDVPRGRPPKQ